MPELMVLISVQDQANMLVHVLGARDSAHALVLLKEMQDARFMDLEQLLLTVCFSKTRLAKFCLIYFN